MLNEKKVSKCWNPLSNIKYPAQNGNPHPTAFAYLPSPSSLIPKYPPTSTKNYVCAACKHKGANNTCVKPKERQGQGENPFSTSGNPTSGEDTKKYGL